MKAVTKKATTIINEDAQKGALLISREWSKEELKTVTSFIDAVKSKDSIKQKEIERKTL
jgi:uncharacterized protein YktA (UPF0223 family)